jgi:hypothetical protein
LRNSLRAILWSPWLSSNLIWRKRFEVLSYTLFH